MNNKSCTGATNLFCNCVAELNGVLLVKTHSLMDDNYLLFKINNIRSWAWNWFYLILILPDKPLKWYTMPYFLTWDLFFENQRVQKWPKMVYLLPIVSFGCNPTEAFKSHPETWEALIIKWSICGEPHIGIKTHQSSNMGHNYALHHIVLLLWPCM